MSLLSCPELCATGLNAIEAYHSDHTPDHVELYLGLAARYRLLVTGGSDFHGSVKSGIWLGTGRNGNLKIPPGLFENLRMAQQPALCSAASCQPLGSESQTGTTPH